MSLWCGRAYLLDFRCWFSGVPAEAIKKFESALAAWGRKYTSKIYDESRREWTVPYSAVYNAAAERAVGKLTADRTLRRDVEIARRRVKRCLTASIPRAGSRPPSMVLEKAAHFVRLMAPAGRR